MNRDKFYKEDEIQSYIEDNIDNHDINDDLHHHIFNQDYYIYGTYAAEQWLGSQVFECLRIVQAYEKDNFGEVITDCSEAEKLVNMFVYIVGETLLGEMNDLGILADMQGQRDANQPKIRVVHTKDGPEPY